MEPEEKIVDDGPWRATRLWNSIIRNLQEGIPQKKHRRNLKTYEKCFTGIEATDWLHKHLKKNPNFDAEVSKEQTILLLQKLVRAGVIVPITLETIQSISGAFHPYSQNVQNLGGDTNTSPSNNTNHIFRSNNDLYRLASDAVEQLRTPGKEPMKKRKYQKRGEESSHKNTPSHRTPLSQLQNNKNDTVGVDSTAVTSTTRNFRSSFRRNKNKLKQKALNFIENEDELYSSNIIEGSDSKGNEENGYSADHRKNLNLSYLQSLPPNSLVVLDNDSTWKEIFTSQLKLTLSDVHVRGLNISTTNIIFNMTNVSPKGVVQLKSIASSSSPTKENNTTTYLQQHDLPHWTLSAMKCLANWPKQIKSHECNEADGATFPSYPGFEQDVFEVVKDYFVGQMNKQGPLTTYKLFDIFVSAYIKAEAIGARSNVIKSESQNNLLNNHKIPQQYHYQHLNGYYAETDLDSGCYVQTSTPSSSVDKVVVHGRDNVTKGSNYGASTFFQMDKSKVWPESEYGLSTTNLKRVAKIRQTYEFCPDNVSNVSKRKNIKPISNNPDLEFNNSPVPLNSEMSATAIMRNFLPPNTCFETAFMNECPVTRIVPQKRSETLHHFEHSKDEVATQRTSSQNCRKLKCYTPIPSGGSITGNAWDTRSIATQTEDEDDEKIQLTGKESKSRSRQPRWKRSVRKRKSIAIMETTRNPTSNHPSSPAKSENGILSSGRINRGFSISPQRHNQCNGNIPQIQRSASTVPYSFMASNVAQNNQVYSNSLDNLLSNQNDRYSVVVDATSDRQQYETISPSENMIRSKTVRAEKRKQKDRRGRSVERFVDSCQYDLSNKMTYPEGRHIHPTMYNNRPKSMAVNEYRSCYENPLPTVDHTSRFMTSQPSNSNAYYSSPNTSNSKSSTSSLSGSASNYQHRSRQFRPSRPSYSNEHHELFHHQNGLSVKTPLRSCPSLLNTDHIPFMDDSNMLYARAEPYQPSLSSEQELESINSKLMSNEGITSAISSFQLLGLLIPPPNRRKLQLLLKFMRRLASKDKLKLMGSSYLGCTSKDGYRKCKDIVLDVFTETIIKPNQDYSNGDMELSRKIVQFFMDHYEDVWTPPAKLRKEVEERVYQSLVSKRLEAGEDPFPITFCKRVPSKIYEKQKQGQALEQAMLNLLEQILFDVKMNMKEKKKKVKKFKESYPDVYKMRFPTEESEPDYMQANESKPITRMSSLAKLKNAVRL